MLKLAVISWIGKGRLPPGRVTNTRPVTGCSFLQMQGDNDDNRYASVAINMQSQDFQKIRLEKQRSNRLKQQGRQNVGIGLAIVVVCFVGWIVIQFILFYLMSDHVESEIALKRGALPPQVHITSNNHIHQTISPEILTEETLSPEDVQKQKEFEREFERAKAELELYKHHKHNVSKLSQDTGINRKRGHGFTARAKEEMVKDSNENKQDSQKHKNKKDGAKDKKQKEHAKDKKQKNKQKQDDDYGELFPTNRRLLQLDNYADDFDDDEIHGRVLFPRRDGKEKMYGENSSVKISKDDESDQNNEDPDVYLPGFEDDDVQNAVSFEYVEENIDRYYTFVSSLKKLCYGDIEPCSRTETDIEIQLECYDNMMSDISTMWLEAHSSNREMHKHCLSKLKDYEKLMYATKKTINPHMRDGQGELLVYGFDLKVGTALKQAFEEVISLMRNMLNGKTLSEELIRELDVDELGKELLRIDSLNINSVEAAKAIQAMSILDQAVLMRKAQYRKKAREQQNKKSNSLFDPN